MKTAKLKKYDFPDSCLQIEDRKGLVLDLTEGGKCAVVSHNSAEIRRDGLGVGI